MHPILKRQARGTLKPYDSHDSKNDKTATAPYKTLIILTNI